MNVERSVSLNQCTGVDPRSSDPLHLQIDLWKSRVIYFQKTSFLHEERESFLFPLSITHPSNVRDGVSYV